MSKEVLYHIKANLYANSLTATANNYAAWAGTGYCTGIKGTCRAAITHGGASGMLQADIYMEIVMQYCTMGILFLKHPALVY